MNAMDRFFSRRGRFDAVDATDLRSVIPRVKRMARGSTAILDLHPGHALWLENASHAWELLSGQLTAIGVEVKAAAAP